MSNQISRNAVTEVNVLQNVDPHYGQNAQRPGVPKGLSWRACVFAQRSSMEKLAA